MISDATDIWCNIISAIYGVTQISLVLGGKDGWLRYVSHWWRGVSLLDAKFEDLSDEFQDNLLKKVGSGLHTYFLRDP